MSLTSYRAAPPRDTVFGPFVETRTPPRIGGGDGVSLADGRYEWVLENCTNRKLQCLATPYSSIA